MQAAKQQQPQQQKKPCDAACQEHHKESLKKQARMQQEHNVQLAQHDRALGKHDRALQALQRTITRLERAFGEEGKAAGFAVPPAVLAAQQKRRSELSTQQARLKKDLQQGWSAAVTAKPCAAADAACEFYHREWLPYIIAEQQARTSRTQPTGQAAKQQEQQKKPCDATCQEKHREWAAKQPALQHKVAKLETLDLGHADGHADGHAHVEQLMQEDLFIKQMTSWFGEAPYHTIPYHTIPYHTIPYHAMPYHTIPCHTRRLFDEAQGKAPGQAKQLQQRLDSTMHLKNM